MKGSPVTKAAMFALFLAAIIVLVVWSARKFVEGAVAPPPTSHPMTLSLSQASCKALVPEMVEQARTLSVNGVVIKAPNRPTVPQATLEAACAQHPMATVAVDRPAS